MLEESVNFRSVYLLSYIFNFETQKHPSFIDFGKSQPSFDDRRPFLLFFSFWDG